MRRLRPLTEAECYARCYLGWDATVQLVSTEIRPLAPTLAFSGEDLRQLFEERIDARDLESAIDEAEAAAA